MSIKSFLLHLIDGDEHAARVSIHEAIVAHTTAAINEEKGRFTSYASWKAAVKKKYPDFTIEGDEDIAQAFVQLKGKRVGVAEWDGAEGYIYSQTEIYRG